MSSELRFDLIVRGRLAPADLAAAVAPALTAIEAGLPVRDFRPLQALVDRSVSPRRFLVVLLGGFAGFALVLAALGVYGVIWYSVHQRTREIGLRLALGATPRRMRSHVLLQTLGLVSTGAVPGCVAAWMLGRTIQGLLFDVASSDATTFAAVLAVLVAVALVAGYLPARHASRIDPMRALRAE